MHRHSHAAHRATSSPRAAKRIPVFKILVLALLVAGLVAVLAFSEFDWKSVPDLLEEVNRPVALLVMAVLPIVGFPISAVYLAAGALFGPAVGGLVVTAITAIHVLATYGLAHSVLRKPILKAQRKWHEKLPVVPEGEYATLVAMIVIVPGLPYIARNCLLVLSGVPLRYLVVVALPLYVARSYVTIFLGNLGNHPSQRALIILGAVFVVKLAISGMLFLRLKHRVRKD